MRREIAAKPPCLYTLPPTPYTLRRALGERLEVRGNEAMRREVKGERLEVKTTRICFGHY